MPYFVHIAISCQMFVVSIKTIKLGLLHILNEKADFKNLFHLEDIYLLFSKMQIKFLISRAGRDYFLNRLRYFKHEQKLLELTLMRLEHFY